MDNNLFLKRFKGSCELVGKEGPLGILNHLHNNITGYKPKRIKTMKLPKKPEPDYSYISSVIKEDFNKNKNFTPQLSILLNPTKLRNNYIYNNVIKSKDNNFYEEKNNFIPNNNNETNNRNDSFLKKIGKTKNDQIKIKYIYTNKNNNNINNDMRKNKLLLNNNANFENHSKEILPLISNKSQDFRPVKNNKNKKSFTPLLGRQYNAIKKKISQIINNLENGESLQKSNSTMSLRSQNIRNIFTYRKNNRNKINSNNGRVRKSVDFEHKKYDKLINNIVENKKQIVNQILLKNKKARIKKQKKLVKDWLNHIKDENMMNSYSYRYNNENNFNYKHDDGNYYDLKNSLSDRIRENNPNIETFEDCNKNESDDNKLSIINEEEEANNKKNKENYEQQSNIMEILMKQRQQYFKNIKNEIKYKQYMEN